MNKQQKTVLVTGANSGIGFETAAQLAAQGYGKVILATRSQAKGDAARTALIERTGKRVFETLVIDTGEPASAMAAADELARRRASVDVLILNAGMSPGPTPAFNSDGVELTFASTLVGHHVLTMRLLENGVLARHARIVIAGSEGARGDLPGMKVADFAAIGSHFGGHMPTALTTIARSEPPYDQFQPMNAYVTAKVYVAWWAAALARKLPHGMVVNAVSPGSVPATSFVRNQSFFMRKVMIPLMGSALGRALKMGGTVEAAAQRYIDAGEFVDSATGHFYGSPTGKLVGPLEVQRTPYFLDRALQDAGWKAIVQLSGGVDYPAAVAAQALA